MHKVRSSKNYLCHNGILYLYVSIVDAATVINTG